MDKEELYRILDIDVPEDFSYYENIASLFEEDEYIDEDLIEELVEEVGVDQIKELADSYFNEFQNSMPDNMDDLYLTVDNIRRIFAGAGDLAELATLISKFREWYVEEDLVTDLNTGDEVNVRDARYNIIASKFTDEDFNYDFRLAYNFDYDGFDILVDDLLEYDGEYDEELTGDYDDEQDY